MCAFGWSCYAKIKSPFLGFYLESRRINQLQCLKVFLYPFFIFPILGERNICELPVASYIETASYGLFQLKLRAMSYDLSFETTSYQKKCELNFKTAGY